MQLKTVEEAEAVVASNKQLHWDGWNIIRLKPNKAGWMLKNGAFKDGAWFQKTVFEPTRQGWTLPDFLRR